MTVKRRSPYLHVTWLAKLMAGDTSCCWGTWFRCHYQNWGKVGDEIPATWLVRHNMLVRRVMNEEQQKGTPVLVEGQVHFRLERPSGLTLAGRPDLLLAGSDPRVVECKTGRPRPSHQTQTMVYMWGAPRVLDGISNVPPGTVIYPDRRVEIPSEAVDAEFEEALEYFIGMMECGQPPGRAPSRSECRFCDIGRTDCADRVEAEEDQAEIVVAT